MAISKAPASDPEQTRHLVHIALDGLRHHSPE